MSYKTLTQIEKHFLYYLKRTNMFPLLPQFGRPLVVPPLLPSSPTRLGQASTWAARLVAHLKRPEFLSSPDLIFRSRE
jgi:hypothetical protein